MSDDRGEWSSFSLFELPSVLLAGLLLLFHRLFEAEAFAVHFKDLRMVSESIQQSGRHAFALEDLAPVAEGEVAGDQQAATFVTFGEHLKQKFGSGPTERQIAQLIHNQQIEFIETFQHPIKSVLLLSFFKLIHQSRRRIEFCPQPVSTGTQAK